MDNNMNSQKIGLYILRLGLAFIFLWFGFSQISDVTTWVSFVPTFLGNFINPAFLVLVNGIFEIVAGICLSFNIFVKQISILLGIHLFFIAVSIGLTSVGVRDIGLALASIALGLIYQKNFLEDSNL